jgi:hypothetical protein
MAFKKLFLPLLVGFQANTLGNAAAYPLSGVKQTSTSTMI